MRATSVIILFPPFSPASGENAHGSHFHVTPPCPLGPNPLWQAMGGGKMGRGSLGTCSAASCAMHHLTFWHSVKRAVLVFYPAWISATFPADFSITALASQVILPLLFVTISFRV